jgi:hypothetical protein
MSSQYASFFAHGDDEIGAIPIVLKNSSLLVLYSSNIRVIAEKELSKFSRHRHSFMSQEGVQIGLL